MSQYPPGFEDAIAVVEREIVRLESRLAASRAALSALRRAAEPDEPLPNVTDASGTSDASMRRRFGGLRAAIGESSAPNPAPKPSSPSNGRPDEVVPTEVVPRSLKRMVLAAVRSLPPAFSSQDVRDWILAREPKLIESTDRSSVPKVLTRMANSREMVRLIQAGSGRRPAQYERIQ